MILVAIPAVALALVSLAAFGGRWIWWLDVLANFRAQYVVGLVVLGLLLMMSKWRRLGYGVLAVCAINLVVVLPLFIGSPADPVSPIGLSMDSYNALNVVNPSYFILISFRLLICTKI